MNTEPIRLTSYARGAGCGCKISPHILDTILKGNRSPARGALLIGSDHNDDAAVLQWSGDEVLISTVDFFAPVLDDPYDFGRAAAANALSDVYAMAGTPLLALAVMGWPVETLPAEMASRVIEGASAVCREAGIPLAGGHTVDSAEPLFGLAVNGRATRAGLRTNAGARPGDRLILTRPVGTGVLATALKRGLLTEAGLAELTSSLTYLNRVGERLGDFSWVHALTDVTGFGLLGHALEMAGASALGLEIWTDRIPVLESAESHIAQFVVADATYRNWNAAEPNARISPEVDFGRAFSLLNDPQTNGGLLLAVDPKEETVFDVLASLDPRLRPREIGCFTGETAGQATICLSA